ncbi:MAG: RNB domain-containing ribonuclease [Polyangiales bacterium]
MTLIDRDNNGRDDRDDLRQIAERALAERGFRTHFPAELSRPLFEHRTPDGALRDLTGLPWSSIDNDLSRDLDQVEYAQRHDGFVRVMVGIAEVASYAPAGGALDRAAMHNTTTVYTAGGIFPMLPTTLSEDATSLLDGQVRRAMVTAIDVAPDGRVLAAKHCPAWVRNRRKLTYESVSAWLDGGPLPPELASDAVRQEQGALQEHAAKWLRGQRVARGGAGFDLPETELVRDADGHVVDIVARTQTRAGAIVEDLMIAVNEAVARTLEGRGFSSIRRVVPPPPRWDRMREVAERWGDALPDHPDARALGAFLARATRARPADAEEIAVSVMKLSGRAAYVLRVAGSDRPGGHFGLATDAYSHSTAPNRRYVDVAIQRLLHAICAGHEAPLDDDTLAEIADRCTVMAGNAARVERQVAKSAAALFLSDRVGQRFEAVVSGVTARGTWVRLFRPAVEGKLVAKAEGLDVGEHLTVRLEAADVARGHLDFSRVEV